MPSVSNELSLDTAGIERQKIVRAGLCHFNMKGQYSQIDDFLANWSCHSNDEEIYDSHILIAGDSHSADKAAALRLNGVDSIQIGGAGCHLTPSYISPDKHFCRKILEFSKIIAKELDVNAIFLSNRFDLSEISPEYLSSIFDFWNDLDKKVYLWSPMPNFHLQMKEFVRGVSPDSFPGYDREKQFFQALNEVEIPENFVIIKSSDFWCPENSNDPTCFSFNNSDLMMVDGDHLSVRGATIFGKRILDSEMISHL